MSFRRFQEMEVKGIRHDHLAIFFCGECNRVRLELVGDEPARIGTRRHGGNP
jgi:hypothetical protein